VTRDSAQAVEPSDVGTQNELVTRSFLKKRVFEVQRSVHGAKYMVVVLKSLSLKRVVQLLTSLPLSGSNMGTYLSTPVTEKHQEEGHSLGDTLTWGVVDMQGWRKTMEDAHIAQTNVDLKIGSNADEGSDGAPAPTSHVFGVFDGHGGPEVARFTALYLVSVLQQQLQNQQSSEGALGAALIETFHALDRMIDDPSRRDELVRLKAMSPSVGEQRTASRIPPKSVVSPATAPVSLDSTTPALETTTNSVPTLPIPTAKDEGVKGNTDVSQAGDDLVTPAMLAEEDDPVASEVSSDENSESSEPISQEGSDTDDGSNTSKEDDSTGGVEIVEHGDPITSSTGLEDAITIQPESSLGTSPSASGLEESSQAATDDAVASAAGNASGGTGSSAAGKVSGMLQRLLKLSQPSGGGVVYQVGKHGIITARTGNTPNVPTASKPTIVRNGQMLCNLPDHAIHAGATAIVAVIMDRTLVVANAGDSRAVLCRGGGVTVALSFDHKPMQTTELARIRAAGGFVNAFGRVNGNLNLSRSVGDLKYKQVPGIPPALQMITAEPDILEYVERT
jgi:serine/threonine protein phosphatase PrpC